MTASETNSDAEAARRRAARPTLQLHSARSGLLPWLWTRVSVRSAPRRPTTTKDWTLEQLKLECTARNLNVAKNTKKDDRVKILCTWDTNKEGVEALLSRQRQRSKRGRGDDDKRTKGCMFRLLNVLFSLRFYELLLTIGNQLRREEFDQGGSTFWIDVAAAFCPDTRIDASFKMAHSAAKLKRMWKEVSSNFARAEAGSKVSGQGSHDFWDFCDGRADVLYLDRWCEHRQGVREFYSANVYAEDKDDSTMEGEERRQQVNRKRRRGSQSDAVATILERVNDLLDLGPVKAARRGTIRGLSRNYTFKSNAQLRTCQPCTEGTASEEIDARSPD
ncbi:hypothetical protein ON010_g7733 [Phytophthora cinnamomi]|nr:hypothetical protein ON010_g7733 [Phytophthora cinnamomi]